MADELKSQINVSVNADEAVQGLNEIGRAAQDSAQKVAQAGNLAADGMEKLRVETEKASKESERLSKAQTREEKTLAQQIQRRTQDLQRENAQLQANSKTSEEYFQILSKSRGADLARLEPYLVSLRKENDLIKANAAVIEEQRQQQELLNRARQQADAANRSREQFIEQLRREADAIGKTRTELLAMKAAELGVSEAASPFLARLQATEKQFDATGRSVRATTALLRQVPQQFTDIVVSLASGQQPLTVFLQQGGQLKDMFGSAGEAARALGGYVLGLINPFTLTAAAVTALGAAYFYAADQGEKLGKALILTGNQIGLTRQELLAMSSTIASLGIAQGTASDALVTFIQSARVGREDLQRFTQAAVEFEKVGGASVEEVAKNFAKLAEEPLKGSLELNKAMNYLTDSTVAAIAELERQGRTVEAARLAQEAYADALEQRTPLLLENLGSVQRAWIEIKRVTNDAVTSLIQGLLQLGTPTRRLEELVVELYQAEQNLAKARAGSLAYTVEGTQARVDRLVAEIAKAQAQIQQLDRSAAAGTQRSQGAESRAFLEQQSNRLLDERTRKLREYGIEVRKTIEAANQLNWSEEQLTERLKALGLAYTEKEKVQRIGRQQTVQEIRDTDALNKLIKDLATAELEAAKAKAFVASERTKYIESVADETAKINERIANIEREREQLGMTAYEIALVTAARRDEEAAMVKAEMTRLSMIPGMDAELARLKEKYDAIIRLRDAELGLADERRTRETANAIAKSAQDAAKEWDKSAQDINKSITDALFRAFESGKGFVAALRDTVVNAFKTMVLRPVVNAAVQPFTSAANSLFFGSASGGSSPIMDALGLSSLATGGGVAGLAQAFVAGGSLTAAEAAAAAAAYSGAGMSATGAAISAGSALGPIATAAPYIAAAAFIVSQLLKDGGGPKTGGQSIVDFAGGVSTVSALQTTQASDGGRLIYSPDQADADIAKLTETVTFGIKDAVGRFGGTLADFTLGLGYDTDPLGDAGNRISSFLSTAVGDVLRNVNVSAGSSADELKAGLSLEVQRLILAGIQASDLPDQIDAIFESVDASTATAEQIAQITAAATAMANLLSWAERLALPLESVTDAMTKAAGGAEALAGSLQTYYANFYTDAERAAIATAELSERFADLGVTLPNTREQFRALVESIDVSSTEGQTLYAQLVSLSGAFAELVPAAGSVTEVIDETARRFADVEQTISTALLRGAVGEASREEVGEELADAIIGGVYEALQGQYTDQIAQSFTDGILRPMIDAVLAGQSIASAVSQASIDAIAQQAAATLTALGQVLSNPEFQAALQSVRDAIGSAIGSIAPGETPSTGGGGGGGGGRDRANRTGTENTALQERESLQRRILELEGDTAALRALELAALDPSNRALQQRIYALEDEQRISQERAGLERELLQLQGDTVALRALEREALDESNRAIYDQVQALREQQAVANERENLELRLLRLQGDTAAIRERERAALDESNRAIYDQIVALEDAQAAGESLAGSWRNVANTLIEEARRIRNTIASESTSDYSGLQARFAITTAQARAGDMSAAQSLTAISSELLSAAAGQVGSKIELIRLQALIAASLEESAALLGTGSPGDPETPIEQVLVTNQSMDRTMVEIKAELVVLKQQLAAIQTNTRRTADATNGLGEAPMIVEVEA